MPVWIDSHFATFDLSHAKHVPLETADTKTYSIVTEVMDDIDIIVIIVACCVCAVLIAIGIAICVKECYRRKHAQSFNLLEVPHVNLKLEDFTLTRIPRPRAIYNDASASVAFKGFSEGEPGTTTCQPPTAVTATNRQAKSRSGALHPSDMHLHVKQHDDGLIVGLTSVCSHYSSSNTNSHCFNYSDVFANGVAQQNEPRAGIPSSNNHPESECQASAWLLGNRCHSDVEGTMNPVFVDDHEEGAEGMCDEVSCENGQERMAK